MKAALSLAVLAALMLVGCEREARRFETPARNETPNEVATRQSTIQPAVALTGNVKQAATTASPYDGNAFATNQGKRLFKWYNCNGCHAGGGGGIGPPLIDGAWRYGGDPASLYQTIVQGRPNGMPSFGGHIPDDQVWQIVAYVRSMSGQLRKDVAPSRSDSLYSGPPENARVRQPMRPEPLPPEVPAGGKP